MNTTMDRSFRTYSDAKSTKKSVHEHNSSAHDEYLVVREENDDINQKRIKKLRIFAMEPGQDYHRGESGNGVNNSDYVNRDITPPLRALNKTTRMFFNLNEQDPCEQRTSPLRGGYPVLATAQRENQMAYKLAMRKRSLNF